MTAPTPNAELAYKVLDHIDAHPEQHDQRSWTEKVGCGTVACFAGWTCLLSGDEPVPDDDGDIDVEVWVDGNIVRIPQRATHLLGLPYDRQPGWGHHLFDPANSREDLHRLVAEIFGPRPEFCGYPLPHPEHDWVKLANDERPVDQDARCAGVADVSPNAGDAS